ncbi:MAG: GrpB family protein [Actinobacteria bacterium]|nr:GrpB family protein [Actinomycetota bacterium]
MREPPPGWGEDEPIEIRPYDPVWPVRFEAERALLGRALSAWIEGGIHHVGSTAVPGLAAKPIVDVMVGVHDLAEARGSFGLLAELDYCHAPYRAWMHWFCKPSPGRRTHHLHLIEPGHPEFAARLAFRDHLRAHPDVAADYSALKKTLAAEHREDREAYTEGKSDFIRAALVGAKASNGNAGT